ncbi:MAG: sulfatase-like hydrolase/transferase [Bacteroidia bacterium]|nr:sulfatase-like hydrolase/transferase [Bacteroidia bacterium]
MRSLLIFLLSLSQFSPIFSQAEKTNLIFILADDLGYGDLASYGHPIIRTPALDQLAREGVSFTQFYSPSPLCSPSRAAMMTGRNPYRSGIKSWIPQGENVYLRKEEMGLGQVLKAAGYQTYAIGKWHLNGGLDDAKHPRPDEHGFEFWLLNHAFALPTHKNPDNFHKNGEALGVVEGYSAQIVVDEAIEVLEKRDPEKPVFLYLPLNEPHTEIASPDEFNAKYASYTKGEIDLENLSDRGPGEYYANISHLDFQVGRLLKKLDELGMRENSLVIFTSDNGPVTTQWRHWWEVNMYGSTGGLRGRKADLFEGGIRVPCIIRFPGFTAENYVSDIPWHGYDLLPSICKVLGLEVPDDRPIDGEDMSVLWKGESAEREKPMFWPFETRQFDDPEGYAYAIRDGNWKLITDLELSKTLLYDLENDPYEVRELSAQHPEVVKQLLDEIAEMIESIEFDPLRPKED